MKQKIFCIGLNKTATTSLHFAFKSIGMRSFHDSELAKSQILKAREQKKKLLYYIEEYDAYSDVPFCNIYKELYEQYPNSKFIMTTRDDESWAKSLQNHEIRHGKLPTKKEILLSTKHKTESDVREYFKEKDQFFEINLCNGEEGWEKVSYFLGIEKPNNPFPHRNRGNILIRGLSRIKRNIPFIKKDDPLL